jgi:hypothetical protein
MDYITNGAMERLMLFSLDFKPLIYYALPKVRLKSGKSHIYFPNRSGNHEISARKVY